MNINIMKKHHEKLVGDKVSILFSIKSQFLRISIHNQVLIEKFGVNV